MIHEVHVRDIANGRVHKRWRYDDHTLRAAEPESPDSSGAYEVMTDAEFENAEAADLCRVCFGEVEP